MEKQDLNRKTPIPANLSHLEEMMKERVGLGTSFDLGVRKLKILKKNVHLYYVNGLCESASIGRILMYITRINDTEKSTIRVKEIMENRIVNQSVQKVKTIDEVVDQVLSGLIAILVEGEEEAFIVDVRKYPGRQPEEPDTEKVVRGSRDGYVENIIVNTALTRRRIRDERLRFELLKVGERSKTDVAIGYIKDVANPDLVNVIRQELESINIDGLPMADKIVEEFLLKQGYTPYPLVRYTERADIAAAHLLEGHVLIFVDTSPSVIMTPTTFFHHVQHAEEYREAAAVGTFVRWTRFLGIFISIFLLPLWYLFVTDTSLLPEQIDYIGPHKKSHIPVVVQLFLADLGIQFFRIASIHTPTPLATAMGLIAAVMVGEIAVEVGLFVPEVILYVSVAAIGTFTTPSYELSIANTLARMFLLVMVVLFKVPGFVIGSTVFLIYLASIRSLNTPYFWPFIPFHPKALLNVLVRRPVPEEKIRPSIVHPKDRYKQPPKS